MSVLVSVADSLPPKPLLHTQLELEAEVGIGLNLRFRYEENACFPSETQEQFAIIRQYFSLLFITITDSFTDSGHPVIREISSSF